jgi:hypothetical protein
MHTIRYVIRYIDLYYFKGIATMPHFYRHGLDTG